MAVKASATVTLSCYRDTQSVTRYYKLQSSTAKAPSKPTTNPPPNGWDDTEPSYTSGSTNTLYFCDLTVFSDGTWAYSSVSKSSSYEAAKEAYNKAQNAQDTANSANDKIDGLEIGGRNLIIRYTETEETWINASGEIETHSSHATSDYIAVIPDTDYMFTKRESELYPGNTAYFRYAWYDSDQTYIGRAANSSKEFLWTAPSDTYFVRISYPVDCFPKFEYGNKATDWSPAPEDVDDAINTKGEELTQTITEQCANVQTTCEAVILDALKSYTETDDFESFKKTVSSQLSLMADNMTVKFNKKTEEINKLNDDLSSKFNTITKYFTFDVNGLTIGQSDSPYKVIIDNDRYSMTVDGTEVMWIANGKVYTPEIDVAKAFRLFGYMIDQDANGNVNCGYVGG